MQKTVNDLILKTLKLMTLSQWLKLKSTIQKQNIRK